MRKQLIILFLLISLLTATPVQSATMVSGRPCPGGATVASCDTATIVDSQTGGFTNYSGFAENTGRVMGGSRFVTSKAYSLCTIKIILTKVDGAGTEPGDISIQLYADNNSNPDEPYPTGSALGTSTTTLAFADTSTSCTEYTFTFNTPVSLSGSTAYWIVYSVDSAGSATDYYRDCNYDTGSPSHFGVDESGIPSWTNTSHAQSRFKTYEYK